MSDPNLELTILRAEAHPLPQAHRPFQIMKDCSLLLWGVLLFE
jgi:hypothetical protein